jgi:hypothetical protein
MSQALSPADDTKRRQLMIAAAIVSVSFIMALGWLLDEAAQLLGVEDLYDSFYGGVTWAVSAGGIIFWVRRITLKIVSEQNENSDSTVLYCFWRIGVHAGKDLGQIILFVVMAPIFFVLLAGLCGMEVLRILICTSILGAAGGLAGWVVGGILSGVFGAGCTPVFIWVGAVIGGCFGLVVAVAAIKEEYL